MHDRYAEEVVWHAPGRGLVWRGREQVLEGLAREDHCMRTGRLIRRRQVRHGSLLLEESVREFDYLGDRFERLVLPVGARIQLQRLRVLTVVDAMVVAETCFESWRVLSDASRTR